MKKKCLSAIVLAILLLCSFPISGMAESDVPGGDEAETGDGLGEFLVLHYDFEGADILEAMEDKATAGSVQDDLQPVKGKVNFSALRPTIPKFPAAATARGLCASGWIRWIPAQATISSLWR